MIDSVGTEIGGFAPSAIAIDMVAKAGSCAGSEGRGEAGADQSSPGALLHDTNCSLDDSISGWNARV